MSKDKTIDLGPATSFLEENTTVDPKGVIRLNKAGFVNFFEEQGVNKQTLDAVQQGHEKLYGGMILMAGRHLEKAIHAAKEAGDNPDDLSTTFDATTLGGSAKVEVKAKTVSPNPRHAVDGGPKQIIKHGGVSLKIKQKSSIPGQAVDDVHALIKGAMGVEE